MKHCWCCCHPPPEDDEFEDHDDDDDWEERELESRIEIALNCKCGAYGITKDGRPTHVADCICGAG